MSQDKGAFDANQAPEKVHTLIPESYRNAPNALVRNAPIRTTFYGQMAQTEGDAGAKFNTNIEPEKVHTLIPEAYRTSANDAEYEMNLGTQRSTFFGQQNAPEQAAVQFNAGAEPEKVHTLIPEAYRTSANDAEYEMNLGTQRSTFFSQTNAEVKYDEKNGLWRSEDLVQLDKADSIGETHRDPWVTDYTQRAL